MLLLLDSTLPGAAHSPTLRNSKNPPKPQSPPFREHDSAKPTPRKAPLSHRQPLCTQISPINSRKGRRPSSPRGRKTLVEKFHPPQTNLTAGFPTASRETHRYVVDTLSFGSDQEDFPEVHVGPKREARLGRGLGTRRTRVSPLRLAPLTGLL